jgi:hypothetical protein
MNVGGRCLHAQSHLQSQRATYDGHMHPWQAQEQLQPQHASCEGTPWSADLHRGSLNNARASLDSSAGYQQTAFADHVLQEATGSLALSQTRLNMPLRAQPPSVDMAARQAMTPLLPMHVHWNGSPRYSISGNGGFGNHWTPQRHSVQGDEEYGGERHRGSKHVNRVGPPTRLGGRHGATLPCPFCGHLEQQQTQSVLRMLNAPFWAISKLLRQE